ncbi:hypothetical protein MMC06_003268 [Schaereria dolodes]|nr:hypothetical protein [Schaereria dolodes]
MVNALIEASRDEIPNYHSKDHGLKDSQSVGMAATADDIANDGSSDYGSDFTAEEEGILGGLLSEISNKNGGGSDLGVADIVDDKISKEIRSRRTVGGKSHGPLDPPPQVSKITLVSPSTYVPIEIEGDLFLPTNGTLHLDWPSSDQLTLKRLAPRADGRADQQSFASVESSEQEVLDQRSPLERFRTKPQKTLSVTDLVSPAWCELQYWYTLTKHGKKRRTPAMRQGSAVHKALEEQVHHTVTVDVQTKEDAWGLRIWNIIQGLRTLRETGMTRELEVFGIVDGLVVNGVIDELSYICPDRDLEEEVTARTTHGKSSKNIIAPDQASITNFLKPDTHSKSPQGVVKSLRSLLKKTSKIYLTDVKTRGVKSIPSGVSFRPTLMQLMLYQLMFSDFATNKVEANLVFSRYDLDVNAHFSDAFIAQIGSLNETFYDAPSDPSQSQNAPDASQDSMQVILDHNSLDQLWGLMMREFGQTLPSGIEGIGNVLKVEYRDQTNGSILGIKTFLYDREVIQNYLNDELSWWKGVRETRGVVVEEAYKCRVCEFAEGCTWRKAKIDEATEVHRTRSRSII